jgi:hypothetical protein
MIYLVDYYHLKIFAVNLDTMMIPENQKEFGKLVKNMLINLRR